jgi:hypothetical protein
MDLSPSAERPQFFYHPPAGVVVSRNVNLRSDPSTQYPEIRLLLPGAELFLLESGKTCP